MNEFSRLKQVTVLKAREAGAGLVSLNPVTQVRHGRLSIGRVWEKQFRQLPFGVGANSESRIVHIKIRFVVNTQFTFYHPDDAVKVA